MYSHKRRMCTVSFVLQVATSRPCSISIDGNICMRLDELCVPAQAGCLWHSKSMCVG